MLEDDEAMVVAEWYREVLKQDDQRIFRPNKQRVLSLIMKPRRGHATIGHVHGFSASPTKRKYVWWLQFVAAITIA